MVQRRVMSVRGMVVGMVAVCLALVAGVRGEDKPAASAGPAKAVAVIHGLGDGKVHGVVKFTEVDGGVQVVADVEGLEPNTKHGFHIHEFGDCSSADGSSAGGHYNPEGHPHGKPGDEARHAGDMGNLEADADGKAHVELTMKGLTINGHHNAIAGRGVIVHAKADDFGQPTGNAGGRIGCGAIGIAKG